MVDVVIISLAKNAEFKKLTMDTVDTLLSSDPLIRFKVYIIESNKAESFPEYANNGDIEVIHPTSKFGYHRYLNIGINAGKNPFVCLCNNDLLFEKGWATSMMHAMNKDPKLLSTSPYSTKPHKTVFKLPQDREIEYGYKIRRHVAGWCIFQKRSIYQKIGRLDERFEFWYADNDYAETLKRKNIKHALVRGSVVEHVESKTLKSKSAAEQHALTRAQVKTFTDKWKIQP